MWNLVGHPLTSRFLLGTAHYRSLKILQEAILEAKTNVITISLKRQSYAKSENSYFWECIKKTNCHLLPNTAGCHLASEAVTMAEMAREMFATNWIKLELIGDAYTLHPDPFELVIATNELIKRGFVVFPYCTDDLIVCQRLIDYGCQILMPWASPIGSGKGIINPYALEILRHRFPDTTLIIDAGIGRPSHAIKAMELGFDGVLLNTAVSTAINPVKMASAFRDAIIAGRAAFEAGMMPERNLAQASTSLIDTPFWHQEGYDA